MVAILRSEKRGGIDGETGEKETLARHETVFKRLTGKKNANATKKSDQLGFGQVSVAENRDIS